MYRFIPLLLFALPCSMQSLHTYSKFTQLNKETNEWSTVPGCGKIQMYQRSQWHAENEQPKLDKIRPELTQWMLVHHTAGKECHSNNECGVILKELEAYEKKHQGTKEIFSHFFIGGDGWIYEGRGWDYPDEYIPGFGLYLSISFIGDYRNKDPNSKMMEAFNNFIECFMNIEKGYCQFVFSAHDDHRCTDCPGKHLKALLEKNEHYDHSKNTRPCQRHKEYVHRFYNKYKKDPHLDHHFKYTDD